MRILLIRHGQTDANKRNIIQGWLDFKLNNVGIKQAKLLAKRLKNENIDYFYSSDLKRAIMTTEEIKKFHPGIDWVKKSIIRERNFGRHEGMPVEEYYNLIKCYGLEVHEFVPPFGESYYDVRRRAEIFFRELVRKHKKDTVAVIAHGVFNKAFISQVFDISLKDAVKIEQQNTCVNIIEVKSKPKLVSLNDYSHLNGYVF
ncbi:MAG: histidine phosphatase family protein [Candidatus Aenigmarchaeota archaeon]|nr:histidine phosphatase family protein [Candidatus Aenigmarchaeota archaeon]